jgi:hypothetical protein
VAATILGSDGAGGYDVQRYWATASGDTTKFDVADLKPSQVVPPGTGVAADLVAVALGGLRPH